MYAVTDRLIKKILYSSNINQKTAGSNKSKVKFNLEQLMKAQMGIRSIALLFVVVVVVVPCISINIKVFVTNICTLY
jgi:hypothetical protein